MPDIDDELEATSGREDESLFARDDNDVLIRREKETRDRFGQYVEIVIDGYSVRVPRAVPKTDSQGNPLRDEKGELIPRTTTIHDAAAQLVAEGKWTEQDLRERIPVLCHQRHVAPVAVCRMCSVQISAMKRGKITPSRKLVPACQHRVEKDMVVTTRAGMDGYNPATKDKADAKTVGRSAETINQSVRMLAQFLVADHCQEPIGERRYDDELTTVARSLHVLDSDAGPAKFPVPERFKRDPSLPGRNAETEMNPKARRFALPLAPMPVDAECRKDAQADWEEWNAQIDKDYPYSSRTVVVDHDRCIVCDRCVRACSEVKPFKIIGHTGRGYGTRISFDLDALMRESNCVQCGECMNSCPTGALSLRRRVQPRAWDDSPKQIPVNPNTSFPAESGFLTADEMQNVWLAYHDPAGTPDPTTGEVPFKVVYPFRSIPYSYLKWNEGSVRKIEIAPGEEKTLCYQGEYGNTAFLLSGTGEFDIYYRKPDPAKKPGFFARVFGGGSTPKPPAVNKKNVGDYIATRRGDELVLGEMACLTQRPRNATVVGKAPANNRALVLTREGKVAQGKAGPVVVYEVTRNMLDMMQRAESARADLAAVYAARAIEDGFNKADLFRNLSPEDRERARTFLLAGEIEVDMGGGKKETRRVEFRRVAEKETIVAEGDTAAAFFIIRIGTVKVFTDQGGGEQVYRLYSTGDYFGETALLSDRPEKRTASVAAIDPVELVRIPGPIFRELIERFPQMRENFAKSRPAVPGVKETPPPGVLREYVQQGLFQGQKLLVLDLKTCTRCDECTRACAQSHDGNARLLREGLRFGDFLVATSCRSCHKPYCMEGCPVDAIHRVGTNLEVKIENHCIGCGLCEKNCPYGAIHMVGRATPNAAASNYAGGNPNMTAARRAVNCDLCNGGEPFCVQACPHVAAYRMAGPDLMDEVLSRLNRKS
jgi:Fe-S-cluster-containing hydrogenase component 2/CRP-like cAMP-binding protein